MLEWGDLEKKVLLNYLKNLKFKSYVLKLVTQCVIVQWSKYLDLSHSYENIINSCATYINQQMLGLVLCVGGVHFTEGSNISNSELCGWDESA